jgi:hypothetical protein
MSKPKEVNIEDGIRFIKLIRPEKLNSLLNKRTKIFFRTCESAIAQCFKNQ